MFTVSVINKAIKPLFASFCESDDAITQITFQDGDHVEVASINAVDLQKDAKTAWSDFVGRLAVEFDDIEGYGPEAVFYIAGEEECTLHIAENGEYIRFVDNGEETLYYDHAEFEEHDEAASQVLGAIASSLMSIE